MVGELSFFFFFFSDIKTIDAILSAEGCSLVFNALTQDDMHINCVILTTSSTHLVSVECLPGATAQLY